MTGKNIRKLVLAALLAALTAVATMIIRIPTPTQGYIHLGDGMVLICGILLGPGLGALAAGIGSMMADLIGGYMAWVPGTFAIKALTALLGGWLYHRMAGKGMNTITRVVLCGIPAEIVMVLGYFVYEVGMEVVMGSSMGAAAAAVVLGVPMNIVQGIAGIIVGAVGLLMGMFWSGPVGIVVGGIVADLIAGDPQKRTKTKLICAFAAFTFCFWLGQISLILMMGEAYAEMCVQAGMTLEYGQTLVNSILSPMGVVTGAATIAGGLVGGFIGIKVFSKHFAKLGM